MQPTDSIPPLENLYLLLRLLFDRPVRWILVSVDVSLQRCLHRLVHHLFPEINHSIKQDFLFSLWTEALFICLMSSNRDESGRIPEGKLRQENMAAPAGGRLA